MTSYRGEGPSLSLTTLTLTTASADTIVLANCKNNGIPSSKIAWFPNEINGSPGAIAPVHTDSGQTVFWEGAQVTATFPDGNYFTTNIPRSVNNNEHAGTGSNKFLQFECWKSWKDDPIYYLGDGRACN
ncbi:hypothetical protein B0J14DRAFT_149370 [Halenospora varia]|nr:hypothetical protein B0J14DRAFT_149370 [Halenospora varia]